MHSIFFEDEVFAEALMNPPMITLVTYLLGYSAVLSAMGCWMKGPCRSNFPLHTDSGGIPEPLPAQSYAAQCTYVLTDFNRENGGDLHSAGQSQVEPQPRRGRRRFSFPTRRVAVSRPSRARRRRVR